MLITTANAQCLNLCYIHDVYLDELHFDKEARVLRLALRDVVWAEHPPVSYTIEFVDVIGFEVTACEFYGTGSQINCIYWESENPTLLPRLFAEKQRQDSEYSTMTDPEDYLEAGIEFICGDHLTVACRQISINKP